MTFGSASLIVVNQCAKYTERHCWIYLITLTFDTDWENPDWLSFKGLVLAIMQWKFFDPNLFYKTCKKCMSNFDCHLNRKWKLKIQKGNMLLILGSRMWFFKQIYFCYSTKWKIWVNPSFRKSNKLRVWVIFFVKRSLCCQIHWCKASPKKKTAHMFIPTFSSPCEGSFLGGF